MAEAELEACMLEMKSSWAAGDIDRMMALYADDCAFASNQGGIQKGKAQLRKTMTEFLAKYASCDFEKFDRVMCADSCTEMGTFGCKQKGTGTVDKGKYLALYVKKDGKWQARFDISVFDC